MRALLAVLLLLPATGLAGEITLIVWGAGKSTGCGQFVTASESAALGNARTYEKDGEKYWSEKASMMEWVYGFLTAINAYRDENHQIQNDSSSVEVWLRNWCSKNPTRNLLDAVGAFAGATPGAPLK